MVIDTASCNKSFDSDVVETDHTFPKESRRRAEDILEEVKATYHVQIFSGVTHGFGTRGDPEVENSRMFYKPFEIPGSSLNIFF